MGFTTALTTAFARRGVPIGLVGMASRDHLIVPQQNLATALDMLDELPDAAIQENSSAGPHTAGADASS